MRACLEKVDEKSEGGGEGSAKENPKIQTPRRRRNHFINASFVREHGAGHGQDIAIRHMRPTWARGECDCPLPLPLFLLASHLPALLTNGSCLHAGHETLRETCHQGWNNVWQSWKSWLFFARRLGKSAGKEGGWVDVSCSRFLVHWIMTFTVVLVVVELRCLRAKFTSFFYHSTPRNLLLLLLLHLRCRHRSSLDSLTVVAKLCRLIKLLYSLERKLSACLIWSSPDGEREREEGA